jgi:hydroxyacylglutathione hydrolase
MSFEIVTIPCLSDNYAYLIVKGDKAAVVDAPESGAIIRAVRDRSLSVTDILLTHHHDDHIQALPDLLAEFGSDTRVIGAKADVHRLPPLDLAVGEGDTFQVLGGEIQTMDVSGHTIGHLAFYMPEAGTAFTADSLMALGCGRVFEGTMPQMWTSLSKLAALPPETVICSGHEYTEANARFAITIEPDNPALQARIQRIKAARSNGEPTVPSVLSEELETNPFVRAHLDEVKNCLNMAGSSDAEAFGEIRRRKDSF